LEGRKNKSVSSVQGGVTNPTNWKGVAGTEQDRSIWSSSQEQAPYSVWQGQIKCERALFLFNSSLVAWGPAGRRRTAEREVGGLKPPRPINCLRNGLFLAAVENLNGSKVKQAMLRRNVRSHRPCHEPRLVRSVEANVGGSVSDRSDGFLLFLHSRPSIRTGEAHSSTTAANGKLQECVCM